MLEKTLVPHKFWFDILIYPPNNSCQSYKEIITLVLFSSSALVLTKTHTIVNVSLENENSIMWWGCFSCLMDMLGQNPGSAWMRRGGVLVSSTGCTISKWQIFNFCLKFSNKDALLFNFRISECVSIQDAKHLCSKNSVKSRFCALQDSPVFETRFYL